MILGGKRYLFKLWLNNANLIKGWSASLKGELTDLNETENIMVTFEEQEFGKTIYLGLLTCAYIDCKDFKKAEDLIKRKKLGHLWYGLTYIRPKQLSPENKYGIHFGVGATYHRRGDLLTIYSDPGYLAALIVHELGHRYYYKFLSSKDRRHFDKWFGKVKATSSYGSSSSPEDFAEVFSDYVIGKDMDRNQIDRFKEVLGRTRRTENYE